MKEIKFRAWDKEKRCWHDIENTLIARDGYVWIFDPAHFNPLYEITSRVEINLATGLKDKNGKEIYEGDVVRWSDGDYKHPSNPRIAEVRFAPELGFWAFNVGEEGHWFGFSNFVYTDTEKHLEVIGNIYEIPELLTS